MYNLLLGVSVAHSICLQLAVFKAKDIKSYITLQQLHQSLIICLWKLLKYRL